MRIAVDLTPVVPGGQNGGFKLFVLGLLLDLFALAPHIEFVLLTSYANDAELALLDAHNARRLCVARVPQAEGGQKATTSASPQLALRRRVRLAMTRVLPPRLMLRIELAYLALTGQQPKGTGLLTGLGADLLFSPFTTLAFYEPGVPSVSLVHDLLFYEYPRFFLPEQRALRHRDLQRAARLADRLVCTSALVHRTIVENADVPPARVVTIQARPQSRLRSVDRREEDRVLDHLGLSRDGFLLYPANFRPHKNHGMLLTAFGIYRARHPVSSLRLVCPGEKGDVQFGELLHTTQAMDLGDWVRFPGFVGDTDLAALYQTCRAVVVPALSARLGSPAVEAQAFQKPLLCARHSVLQEVAGQAAVYFDPRLLSDVVQALELAAEGAASLSLGVPPGQNHANGDNGPTAEHYLRLFCEVAA